MKYPAALGHVEVLLHYVSVSQEDCMWVREPAGSGQGQLLSCNQGNYGSFSTEHLPGFVFEGTL